MPQLQPYPARVNRSELTDKRYLLAGLSALPIFVWWLGWSPGFASSDSIDQFGQIQTGEIFNFHPAIHTLYMGALSLGGSVPELVTLFQLAILGVLLAYGANWLVKAGVPLWIAVGIAILIGASPAVAPTTLALWKDVPFGLFVLWAWIELLALGVDRSRLERTAPLVRLGIALAGVWLFRGNGPLTVMALVAGLVWLNRRQLRPVLISLATAALLVVMIVGPLYSAFDVRGGAVEPAEVFLADVAASYSSNPDLFDEDELLLMKRVAPLEVWSERYDCFDSTALLFDPEFDQSVLRDDPGPYRRLVASVAIRDFGTVAGHHWCAANFVYAPRQPADAYFHRPPYSISDNDVGLERDPKLQAAFEVTDRVWRWAEIDERLWLTWRPAILILPALAGFALLLFSKRGRPLLLAGWLFVAHTLNVALLSPAQEFRYAYPLYLVAPLMIAGVFALYVGRPKSP